MQNLTLKRLSRKLKPETILWMQNRYPVPFPFQVKLHTLFRNGIPNSDWIETGTYLAETTVALARHFPKNNIYTIEPGDKIHRYVSKKFSRYKNIKFVHGSSEQILEATLARINGHVNLWLDGHYSGDITYRGSIESPVLTELGLIRNWLSNHWEASIFIDDFRLFGEAPGYPTKLQLVEWAEALSMKWTIENDIFIAKT